MSTSGTGANAGANGTTKPGSPELVNLVIDGKPVSVPKGTNLIEAAKSAGIDIPYYCYHQHLSVAGNCRMCQVKVKGAPKLDIGCNTAVREGMDVQTHHTCQEVKDAQAATLEFILINHPLDCTVCDQAGHCKLQDYHFDYNGRPSRFLENKEHKVKAEPLGPTVMLDGERCIMCTRCIRFCDEITKTSELGMLNRGDKSVIAVSPGRELNNPLSGTVVDLCPVGALTHKHWRFNTRIWFTKQAEAVCPGCSTGCSVKVAERDGEVVHVKARLNSSVNKEWLCDEGRYGFMRFLPKSRINQSAVGGKATSVEQAIKEAKRLTQEELLVFVAPDLLLEEYALLKEFLEKYVPKRRVVMNYRERSLSEVEKILVSPDYAPNFRGAEYAGLLSGDLTKAYEEALQIVRAGNASAVWILGDRAVDVKDCDAAFVKGLERAKISLASLCDAESALPKAVKVLIPGRSILEKSGLLVNRGRRLQYSERVCEPAEGTEPEWRIIGRLAAECGGGPLQSSNDREVTMQYFAREARLKGLRISLVKSGSGLGSPGIDLNSYQPQVGASGSAGVGMSASV